MTRSETIRGSRCRSRAGRRAPGPSEVRLLLEPLEDRLPPGDAVFAGLLARELIPVAGRVADPGPVVPPEPTRRLASLAPFDLAADLNLVTDVSEPVREAPGLGHAATSPRPLAELEVLAVEPVASPKALLGQPDRDMNPHPRPDAFTLEGASGAPGLGNLGALAQPRSPTAANYQLDQAVAALALPAETVDDGEGTRGARVRALFNLGHPTTGPFPSNWFTVGDDSQLTDRRVNLPYPDCKVYVSDCEDIAVLNELDGFNLQPRLSILFSGPIDVNSVHSTNVFLVSLDSTTKDEGFMPRGHGVGINQIVWDVETNTLHVESDELLAQHTRFALYVTRGVRDAQGDPVQASPAFRRFLRMGQGDYHEHLLDAMLMAQAYGFRERDIVAASVFTTQSATAVLEKIRDQIHAATPEPADFLLGPKGERAVFSLLDETSYVWRQQTGTNPPTFTDSSFNLGNLRIIPGVVGQIAFGKFLSPDYTVHPGEYIPAVGTRPGVPVVQGVNEVHFNVVLPSGPKPVGGWPVAIIGHGGGGNKQSQINLYGASLAAQGVASVAINAPGHGFGPLGTLTVNPGSGPPVTFLQGGRGIDQDRNNVIGNQEGLLAAPPRSLIDSRDGIRQAVADLMQLVRVIEVGVDIDGDGARDLDPARISYDGQSTGSAYGTPFVAVEPSLKAGFLSAVGVTGGRLAPANRPGIGARLAQLTPSLINSPGVTEIDGVSIAGPHFDENFPLREGSVFTVRLDDGNTREIRSPVINTVSGAAAINEWRDNVEWAAQSGSPGGYAAHLRRELLPGVPARSVLIAFARGDQTVTNPSTSALLRAGDLADRTTYYRHDVAFAENPQLPRNPHSFVSSINVAAFRSISLEAQRQLAVFFASDGKQIIQPEPKRYFEVPIQGPLPEELNFIP